MRRNNLPHHSEKLKDNVGDVEDGQKPVVPVPDQLEIFGHAGDTSISGLIISFRTVDLQASFQGHTQCLIGQETLTGLPDRSVSTYSQCDLKVAVERTQGREQRRDSPVELPNEPLLGFRVDMVVMRQRGRSHFRPGGTLLYVS